MINTVDCFAERYGMSMHLFVQGEQQLKVYQAASAPLGVFGTLGMVSWQLFVSFSLMVLASHPIPTP